MVIASITVVPPTGLRLVCNYATQELPETGIAEHP
jgi:hypothetical protein